MDSRHALPSCYLYPKEHLWMTSTGYFYNNIWYPRHCYRAFGRDVRQCLHGTRLVITGDSTTLAWYKFLQSNLSCSQVSGSWPKNKWHRKNICVIRSINFTMEWLPHGQPFYGGTMWHTNKYTISPIARHINELNSDVRTIIVIHLYIHFTAYHHNIFRDRVRLISKSVRDLFLRNKNATVLIKGPHTYSTTSLGSDCLNDYFGYLYRDILFEEFQGLHDRVIYTDQKDMTIAKCITSHHPPQEVVTESVYQMLSYICE